MLIILGSTLWVSVGDEVFAYNTHEHITVL